MNRPPPTVPRISPEGLSSKCPLCRVRADKTSMLEQAPSLEAIHFVGLVTGIVIGQTEIVDKRWCSGCREYVERLKEVLMEVKPS
jgi:hypothetical protein